jgi:predicted transcriptional regulator
MKRILALIIILLPIFTSGQILGKRTPDWVKNTPKSSENYYAVGEGSSATLDVAERKARLNANVKLAEQVGPVVKTETTRFENVVRNNKLLKEKVYTMRKTVVASLHDTRIVEQYSKEKNGVHTVYLLVEMPKKSIAQSIISQVNNDKDLHRALAGSRAYKKLLAEAK